MRKRHRDARLAQTLHEDAIGAVTARHLVTRGLLEGRVGRGPDAADAAAKDDHVVERKRQVHCRSVAYRAGSEPLSKQLTIVVGLTVVGFMAFGLALSFYRNILFEKTLKQMEIANKDISRENDAKYRELDYYKSEQFKDKYAKQNLGRINPGEKMLIITAPSAGDVSLTESGTTLSAEREAAFMEFLRQMPVHEQWWLYLFDRDKLNRLKETI